MKRGYLTVAAGSRRYLEIAIDAALSVKAFNSEPVALICDEAVASQLPRDGPAFDHIVPLPDEFNARNLWTLALGRLTPFHRTIAFDADYLALRSFSTLWESLDGAGFAMQGELLGRDSFALHHGLPVGLRLLLYGRHRYLKGNSGVLYFEREAGKRYFESAARIHRSRPRLLSRFFRDRSGRISDEVLLGLAASDTDVELIDPPVAFPWYPELWTENPDRYLGIHVLGPVPETLWTKLAADIRSRRRAAGLAADASIDFWEDKARRGHW